MTAFAKVRGRNGRECEFVRSGGNCSTRFLAERQNSCTLLTLATWPANGRNGTDDLPVKAS